MDGRIQHAIDANQLLVYVRARDPIYNPHLTEYNNLEVVNKLWEEIAEEMEAPGLYTH
jgi:Alcohol dehydrogenase transcription factor Myb/SANT-like.